MLFLPLTLVTSAVSDIYFLVVALCIYSQFKDCFGFCVQDVGTRVLGRVPISRVAWHVLLFGPPPNTAVKWDGALKRVAPYF